jgi:hypothetical protein
MEKEIKYQIKDVVYTGNYLLLLKGKEMNSSQLQNLFWEIIVDGELIKTVRGFKILPINNKLNIDDTILETSVNLSFLTRIKNKKNKVFLKRKEHKDGTLTFKELTKEEIKKQQQQDRSFFISEKTIK